MNEPLLDVRNLRVTFGPASKKIVAVDDISFTIRKGEIVGLVGESGSGKSVTSLSIMQLIPDPPGHIDRGKMLFCENGQSTDLLGLLPEATRHYRGNKIGMIFQEPMSSLNPVFTCGHQVMEAIELHQHVSRSEARQQVISLFEQVQLPEPEKMLLRYPHQLSGGQKQRVMIAMAISCHPKLLIADEPTTALDVTVQKTILSLLKSLQQQQTMSVLFITHDLGVVSEIADRVLVMFRGKIVEEGTVAQIFQTPQHPYTRGLLACRPAIQGKLKKLPVIADFMEEKDGILLARETNVQLLLSQLSEDPALQTARVRKMQADKPLLQVRDLVTRFPGKKNFMGKTKEWTYAVNAVSFDVYPGETLGLVGESGCGKTTLGRSILQLIRPTSGQAIYRNQDLCLMSGNTLRKLRKHIQIIFQDPYSSLNPRLTVGQAIMEPMKVHRLFGNEQQRKAKAQELLHKVNLDVGYFDRYPHEFSGGQRQRIGIARALAVEPDFIICDESVSALDVSVQAQVLNLLLKLREELGFSCIFISHDLSVVKFMCDRIMVMYGGKIEEIGLAEDLYHHPQSAFTRHLINAIPKGWDPEIPA